MKNPFISPVIVLIGALLFNYIFWMEKMGVNTAIFTIFIIGILLYTFEESRKEKKVQILMAGTFLLSVLVVLNNSLIAKLIYIMSFSTMVGLVQQREVRFLFYAFSLYFANIMETPKHFLKEVSHISFFKGGESFKKQVHLWVIPVIVVPIFYCIYYAANARFADLSNRFWGRLFEFFNFNWNIEHIIFFILGIIIVGATVWRHGLIDFKKYDSSFKIFLNQEDYTLESPEQGKSIYDSYKSGIILVVLLNLLLLLNNILDIQYVWIGDSIMHTPQELKSYVHEGTYILIFGIVLALAVVFWLFRGSLNFIQNNQILRGWTYVWLVQNGILALSVGMRNWQYIDYYGLAYKRVGVFIFLSLVLIGLWILYLKIKEKRSFFYFITRGAWAIYGIMLAACFVNWDVFISNYNLNSNVKSGFIDVEFLVNEISDKNIKILYQNADKIIAHLPKSDTKIETDYRETYYTINDSTSFRRLLDIKRGTFIANQKNLTWLSWNYPDYLNTTFLR